MYGVGNVKWSAIAEKVSSFWAVMRAIVVRILACYSCQEDWESNVVSAG
jgi:hypothetical protein